MPGFGNNSQNVNGYNLSPGSSGTKRFPLTEQTGAFMPISVTNGSAVSANKSLHSGSISTMDEIYLWAVNNGGSNSYITISFDDGRVEDLSAGVEWRSEKVITMLEPSGGAVLVWPGIPIISIGEDNSTIMYASGSAYSKISVHGYVMRRNKISATDSNQGYDGSE